MIDPPSGATRLGILSDTHGRVDTCRTAVRVLVDLGAQALAHCGDVGTEAVLDELAGHPVWFVWGNTDADRAGLGRYAADLGLNCLDSFGRFVFAARQFAITHGDDGRLLDSVRAAAGGDPTPRTAGVDDFLLSGHTHVPHDRKIGHLRWINPGALYRAQPKTVALLDVAADTLTWREIR